jgi:Putative lumazine-binding
MEKLNQAILILLVLIFGVSNLFANEKEVTARINQYLSAINEMETTVLDNLVNDEAIITIINKIVGKKELLSEKDYMKIVKSGKVGGWVRSTDVKIVSLQNELAIAYIESESNKLIRKEFLTLVIEDGNWEIVNSVSSLSKK